jgi:hypothetical protein
MKIRKPVLLLVAGLIAISCEKDRTNPVRYQFNDDILLSSILQNDKKFLEFAYDSLNRLVQSDQYYDDTAYSRTIYSYDSNDRIIEKQYDGFTETYEYDAGGLLKSIVKAYPSTDKVWKRTFIYENGRISKAQIFFNDVQTDDAIYEYDADGNTQEIREYATSAENAEFIMIHSKFSYDKSVNPLYLIGFIPVDLVQVNNPDYVYFSNALMCRGPIEYDATFEYDTSGVPMRELRTHKGSAHTDTFTYQYQQQ